MHADTAQVINPVYVLITGGGVRHILCDDFSTVPCHHVVFRAPLRVPHPALHC